MIKHRGFPSRLPGTDYQFTIRRASKKKPSKLVKRMRFADRKNSDRLADEEFLRALWNYFGENDFERGNLDAGRLSWVFGREVKPADEDFAPDSYGARLRLDKTILRGSFPQIFEDSQ